MLKRQHFAGLLPVFWHFTLCLPALLWWSLNLGMDKGDITLPSLPDHLQSLILISLLMWWVFPIIIEYYTMKLFQLNSQHSMLQLHKTFLKFLFFSILSLFTFLLSSETINFKKMSHDLIQFWGSFKLSIM